MLTEKLDKNLGILFYVIMLLFLVVLVIAVIVANQTDNDLQKRCLERGGAFIGYKQSYICIRPEALINLEKE